MRIAVIGGTGKEGRGLSLRWARAGHQVFVGSRDGQRGREMAEELSRGGAALAGGDNPWAVAQAEVALLAVPYSAHRATLEGLRDVLQGKVLIDITVPLKPPSVRVVHLPAGQSAAQEAQALLGDGVRVAAALHHVGSAHLQDLHHGIECDVLVCSDDPSTMELTLNLLQDLPVRAFDAGPLQNSVALESLTPVLLHLNRRYKRPGVGIRLVGVE